MKDFIYVDSDLATSYFAQLNRGMISKVLSTETTNDTSTNQGGSEKIGEASGSLAGLVGAKYTNKEIDTFSQAFMKSNSETVENVLHDYLIDLLIDGIEVKSNEKYKEGDFIVHTDEINVFDFGSMKTGISRKTIENFYSIIPEMKQLRNRMNELKHKKNKSRQENLELVNLKNKLDLSDFDDVGTFIQLLDNFFPDMIIIKVGETVSLCSIKNLRLTPATLVPINSSKRKVTVFGQVISIVNENSRDMPDKPMEMMSKANVVFPEILFNAINIKKDGDYNVRPIAIYFEDEKF